MDDLATGTYAVQTTAGWSTGFVPHFRAGARDRGAAGVDARVHIAPFDVRARWDWIVDHTPAGGFVHGPGDLRLGTLATVARPGAFDFTLGWEVKLPNARDEDEIGTDETDVSFGGTAGWRGGALHARVGVGLAVLGNPLRFANQDDVPLARAELGWTRPPFAVVGRASAELPTARNPVRAGGDVAVRWGERWHIVVHGGGGFAPASADWQVGMAVGYAGPLPVARPGA